MSEYKLGFNKPKIESLLFLELGKILRSQDLSNIKPDEDITDILDPLGLLEVIENLENSHGINLDEFDFRKFPPMQINSITDEIFRVLK